MGGVIHEVENKGPKVEVPSVGNGTICQLKVSTAMVSGEIQSNSNDFFYSSFSNQGDTFSSLGRSNNSNF